MMRDTIRKIIAVLLLILFLEKAELRLFIHNHFHESITNISFSKKDTTNAAILSSVHCDCLDDFFIPLALTDETLVPSPAIRYNKVVNIVSESHKSIAPRFSVWLRGPPTMG